jgi:hypothetical protein
MSHVIGKVGIADNAWQVAEQCHGGVASVSLPTPPHRRDLRDSCRLPLASEKNKQGNSRLAL